MNTTVEQTPFFNVNRFPLYADYNGQKVFTKKSAIINEDNGNIYGLVSPKYNIITNREVADVFDEAFKDYPVTEIKDHVNNDGSKWYRDITFGDKYQKEVQAGDIVQTRIRIHNSYDGLSSVGYEFGSLRLVCTNGLTSFQKKAKVTFRHFQLDIVDQIKKSFDLGVERFLEEMEIYKKLAETPYTEKKFVKFVLDQVKEDEEDNGLLSEKQANKIIDLYPHVRNQFNDHEDSKWSNLNVLTAIQTHHIKAHKGSNQFSAGYRRMQNLIERFVHSDQ